MSNRIEKSVELNAPVERVWQALTNHDEFGTWFKVKLDQPFAVGGEPTGHITYPGYEHVAWKAEIVEMDEPRLFSFRWPWTLVEFRLEPSGTGTRLTVIESGFDALPANRRAENHRLNEQGWTEQMGNIKAHVES